MTINELDEYFSGVQLPAEIDLNDSTHIRDVHKFVDSHLSVLRKNEDRAAFSAFYDRLAIVKGLLEANSVIGK